MNELETKAEAALRLTSEELLHVCKALKSSGFHLRDETEEALVIARVASKEPVGEAKQG